MGILFDNVTKSHFYDDAGIRRTSCVGNYDLDTLEWLLPFAQQFTVLI